MKDDQSDSEFLANPSRKIKASIIAGSALMGIIAEASFPGWGRVAAVTLLLVGAQLALWHPWWTRWRFWEIGTVLFAIHLSFVIAFRGWINSISPLSLFGVLIGEVLLSGIALSFTDPSLRPKS